MSDSLIGNPADLQDIAGLHLLGRGLNRLDWASKSKECQKVGDTASDKRAVTYQNNAYALGKHVDFSAAPDQHDLTLSFSSSEDYEQHIQTHLTSAGHYGALSSGFSATFGASQDSFVHQSAALYSHSESLWKLSLGASPETGTQAFKDKVSQLPERFDASCPEAFAAFFVEFGTDIVTEVVVGGSFNYALSSPTRYLAGRADIQALLKAECDAFITTAGNETVDENIRRHIDHRNASLSTLGGNYSIRFDPAAPLNCHADLLAWRHSVPKAPKVIGVDTCPVFRFVEPGILRDALKQAYDWYTGQTIEIDADWQSSQIRLGDSLFALPCPASTEPALRIVFIQEKNRQSIEMLQIAPPLNADADAFDRYWAGVSLVLEQQQRQGGKLLLSTERWPRDPRYFPCYRMREALLQHGARPQTLDQWEQLSQDMGPCPMAGLTYALVGNDSGHCGIDGVVAGFGTPGKNLNPTVNIHARLAHDSFGRMQPVKQQATILSTRTALYTLTNHQGKRLSLGLDPQDKSRVSLQIPDSSDTGQLWYMPQQQQRYDAIRQPTLLINYQTGACLQGHRDQSDSRLTPLGDWLEDDVLWDLRGNDEAFHLLMVYFFPDALCLSQYDNHNAAVRAWHNDGMHWSRRLSTL